MAVNGWEWLGILGLMVPVTVVVLGAGRLNGPPG